VRTSSIVIAAALLTSSATAATHNVPGDFATIAAAAAAAVDGDVIKISKGTYAESVTTHLRLTFVGQKGTIWDGYFGAAHNSQLTATADNVTVKGIEFRHGIMPVTITGDDASISGCTFRACEVGVMIDGARGDVSKNLFTGLTDSNSDMWAIEIVGPDSVVHDNEVTLSYPFGVHLDAESSGTATLTCNVFETNEYYGNIYVENATAPMIKKNEMSNCHMEAAAIDVDNCNGAMVIGNVLSNMNYYVYYGIDVDGDQATVSKNVLESLNCYSGDHYGIQVSGNDAKVDKNKISATGAGEEYETYGIYISGDNASASKNKISYLGGGGEYLYGIRISGDDATASQNDVHHLNDEATYAIYCTGDRFRCEKNDIHHIMDGYGVYVSGDDFKILDNTLKKGAYDAYGIYATGDATTPGAAVIKGTSVTNFACTSIEVSGNGTDVSDNKVKTCAYYGIAISGNDNALKNNTVCGVTDDAYYIDGDNNTLTKCVAKDADNDGYEISGDANSLISCEAKNCAAEGFDNGGGTNTNVRKCRFMGSRIDYAGDNNVNDDIKNKYQTGGPGTAPEL